MAVDGDNFKISKMCGIGAETYGIATCSVFALNHQNIEVNVVDEDKNLIDSWNEKNLTTHEPSLREIIAQCKESNLTISAEYDKHVSEADIILICSSTRSKKLGVGKGCAADLSSIEQIARKIAALAKPSLIVVLQSAVQVGATDYINQILNSNRDVSSKIAVLYNPPFISEGVVVESLLNPDHVIIGGCLDDPASIKAVNILQHLYAKWVADTKIVNISIRSAEVAKLVTNAFLAQRISSVNSISSVCEETGADLRQVTNAVGLDGRIGPYFLESGLGFGGNRMPTDIRNLVYTCESINLPTVAAYWNSVLSMNTFQGARFFKTISSHYCQSLYNKRLAVLGCAFKPGTPTIRESPAIAICAKLLKENAILSIYDPFAPKEPTLLAIRELLDEHSDESVETEIPVTWTESPMEAIVGTDGIIFCNKCDEFKNLDYQKMYDAMRKPASIFDCPSSLHHERLKDIGFRVEAIGVCLK